MTHTPKMRTTLGVAFLLGAVALSACSKTDATTATSEVETTASAACAKHDPLKAVATPLTDATSVVMTRATPVSDSSDMKIVTGMLERQANGTMLLHYNGVADGDVEVTSVYETPEATYATFAPGVVDGLKEGQWVRFNAGTSVADDLALGEKIDFAITGDAELGGGLQQLGGSYDFTNAVAFETADDGEGGCMYSFKDETVTDRVAVLYTVSTDADGRLTLFSFTKDGVVFDVTVSYEAGAVVEPIMQDVAPDEIADAYLEKMAKSQG